MRNCESFFPKHKFGEWEDYKQYHSERGGEVLLIQKRTCDRCGKTEMRKEWA